MYAQKCTRLEDYQGDKVLFLKGEDNGLILSKIWVCYYICAMENVRLGQ